MKLIYKRDGVAYTTDDIGEVRIGFDSTAVKSSMLPQLEDIEENAAEREFFSPEEARDIALQHHKEFSRVSAAIHDIWENYSDMENSMNEATHKPGSERVSDPGEFGEVAITYGFIGNYLNALKFYAEENLYYPDKYAYNFTDKSNLPDKETILFHIDDDQIINEISVYDFQKSSIIEELERAKELTPKHSDLLDQVANLLNINPEQARLIRRHSQIPESSIKLILSKSATSSLFSVEDAKKFTHHPDFKELRKYFLDEFRKDRDSILEQLSASTAKSKAGLPSYNSPSRHLVGRKEVSEYLSTFFNCLEHYAKDQLYFIEGGKESGKYDPQIIPLKDRDTPIGFYTEKKDLIWPFNSGNFNKESLDKSLSIATKYGPQMENMTLKVRSILDSMIYAGRCMN